MNHRLYLGLGILILLLIAGGTFLFYSQYNELQQLKKETAEADKLLEEHNKPITDNEPPTAREGFKMVKHGDDWHEVPIDAPDTWQQTPVVSDAEVTPQIVAKPDWIYDPDREKPDGWDPNLVYEIGDKKIDLNSFRPLTEEEQAEYERLKATENLEAYGRNLEAELRFVAIINVQTDLTQRINSAISNNPKEAEKLHIDYKELYGSFPNLD